MPEAPIKNVSPAGFSVPAREVSDEERIQELAQAHLAAIVENSEDAIASKSLEGIVTSWNQAAERLFHYSAQDMIGHSIKRIIPPELWQEEDQLLAKLRAGERILRYETVRVRKDGARVDISLTLSPLRDRTGKIVGAAKIAHDITARKRFERELAEEAHALETLNRVGQSVAAQVELDNVVQIVTDAATELSRAAFGAFFYSVVGDDGESFALYTLSGASREDFAGFPMPRNTDLFAATFRNRQVVRSDDIERDPRYGKNVPYAGMPPGHLRVRSYLAVPVLGHSGAVLGGLFFGHPETHVFTPRAERLVVTLATQAGIGIDKARLIRTLRSNETQLLQSAAERNQILESERQARSEAERLGHLKDEFLATLSHELRTPLNAIQGWTHLLRQPGVSERDRLRGLETIDRNVRAQAQIVNDLLDMSRIISGKVHLEVRPLQLPDLIRGSLEAVRQSAEAKGLQIEQNLDERIGLVRGDPNRMQQILWNLLSNAVKFTPAGGRVGVTLRRSDANAEIVIEDSGIGIRPEFLPHVFDRFRQADATTTRRYGGLGLGLSIVRNLIELHGGTVSAASAGENQGATFVLSLPVPELAPQSMTQSRQSAPQEQPDDPEDLPRLDGVSVLVVDDSVDGRTLIARILEGSGALPRCVASAEEALKLVSERSFDVMLSDIGMPEMDGYELIRRIRESASGSSRNLPAVAVTAYARREDQERSARAGYQIHLCKPIDARELLTGIAGLVQGGQAGAGVRHHPDG